MTDSEHSKDLLNRLAVGSLTMEEFLETNARWFIDCDIPFLSSPLRPPELIDYDNLSERERDRVKPDFWRQKSVYAFAEEKERVRATNKGNLEWLYEFKRYIPKEDEYIHKKYQEQINRFLYPKPVEDIKDFFGGSVL